MSYVDTIVDTFGGVRPMATAIGCSPSTVMSWKVRGSIPDQHKLNVLTCAKSLGFELSEVQFFPHAESSLEQACAGPYEPFGAKYV
ncbi:carph-isopro domain-containing protein [Pelagimonas varians]